MLKIAPHFELLDKPDNFSIIVPELTEFRSIVERFASIVEGFAAEVDQEKMRAVGVQNLLKTFSKQRESEQQQIQVCN